MDRMKRFRNRRGALGALVVIGLLVSACASASSPGPNGGPQFGYGAPAAGSPAGAGGTDEQTKGNEGRGGGGGGSEPAAPQDQALVVKTGTVTLEVTDLSVLVKARTAIVGLGGYVSGSQQSSGGDRKVASVTYRIPAARWDQALDALKGLATKLVSEQTQAVEVTGQVLDLGARIENLRSSERALQEIMSRATRIADVLEVQARLSQVRGEIEQLATQKAHLEEQAAYGTLTVTWDVPVAPVQEVSSGWDVKAEVERAVSQLVGLGQGLATIVIWFSIVLLPIILVAGLAIAGAALVARRLGIRRREPDVVA
jgi:hypothetical protein